MEIIKVCQADDAENEITPLLNQGYKVKSMCAEQVCIAIDKNTHGGVFKGDIIFILEKYPTTTPRG